MTYLRRMASRGRLLFILLRGASLLLVRRGPKDSSLHCFVVLTFSTLSFILFLAAHDSPSFLLAAQSLSFLHDPWVLLWATRSLSFGVLFSRHRASRTHPCDIKLSNILSPPIFRHNMSKCINCEEDH